MKVGKNIDAWESYVNQTGRELGVKQQKRQLSSRFVVCILEYFYGLQQISKVDGFFEVFTKVCDYD